MILRQEIWIWLLAALSGGATFVGAFLGSVGGGKMSVAFGTSFAAGIMVLISVFELIPEGYGEIGGISLFWILIGALIVWIINLIIPHIHSIDEEIGRANV